MKCVLGLVCLFFTVTVLEVTAGDLPAPPCDQVRDDIDHTQVGVFIPQCTEDGYYLARQCHGSTGHCWCATKMGQEIEGTRVGPIEDEPECSEVNDLPPCHGEAVAAGDPMPGLFIPQCTNQGYYESQQCHGSTGYCWCSTMTGEEVEGTKKGPGQQVDCDEINDLRPCHNGVVEAGEPMPGSFIPQCTQEGYYQPLQCHGSTGYCWCATMMGEEVDGTKTEHGEDAPQCDQVNDLEVCHKEALSAGEPMPGKFVPQCTYEGDYKPQQCHGSTGQCWCTTGTGEEIVGTRTQPGDDPPDCQQYEGLLGSSKSQAGVHKHYLSALLLPLLTVLVLTARQC